MEKDHVWHGTVGCLVCKMLATFVDLIESLEK